MGLAAERNSAFPVTAGPALVIELDLYHAPAASREDAIGRRILMLLAVLAGYTALTALFFWSVLPHLSSALLGPPEDNLQDFWNSWYAINHPHGAFFFTRLIRAPEGVWLYYHSFAYPQIFAVWTLSRIFGAAQPTLILLQNMTILASFPLAAIGAFYICRFLRASFPSALVGGFIFAFNPWHVAQALHHAHVAGIEFLPLFALCYLLASKRRSYSWLAAAALAWVLCALSSWYYLFYGIYFVAFQLLYLVVHRRAAPRPWDLVAPLICLAGACLLLSPLLLPMLAGGFGSTYRAGANIYVADLLGYTAFPPTHLLANLGGFLFERFTGNVWEATVYLGLVNLALIVWGFRRARDGERRVLWYALGGMIFFAVLASGEALHVGGQVLPIHLPGLLLSKLPFFANVRTPARAIVLVYMFLGIGVAMTITTAQKLSHSVFSGAMLAACLALLFLDYLPARLEITPMACESGLATLKADPGADFAVLDLPSGYREANFYMAQQTCHGQPIAQGIIARQLAPTLADHLEIRDFGVQRRQLYDAKIKYILLHHPKGNLFSWHPGLDGDLAEYRRTYAQVTDTPDMMVLKVY